MRGKPFKISLAELLIETGPLTLEDLATTCDLSTTTVRRKLDGLIYRHEVRRIPAHKNGTGKVMYEAVE